jgi:hypothetical protein
MLVPDRGWVYVNEKQKRQAVPNFGSSTRRIALRLLAFNV